MDRIYDYCFSWNHILSRLFIVWIWLLFIIWHSLPSLKSQIRFLYEGQVTNPFIKYLKSGFIYWMFAIIGLIGFYFLGVLPEEQYISVFFSFLAAITFPHVVVMGLMFKSSD